MCSQLGGLINYTCIVDDIPVVAEIELLVY